MALSLEILRAMDVHFHGGTEGDAADRPRNTRPANRYGINQIFKCLDCGNTDLFYECHSRLGNGNVGHKSLVICASCGVRHKYDPEAGNKKAWLRWNL